MNMPPYKVMNVACEILKLGENNNQVMTHKKVQKLCYYAQALYIAIHKERFIDTYFEAWIHGPVSPELYDIFKLEYKANENIKLINIKEEYNFNDDSKEYLKFIIKMYGDYTGDQLEMLTHSEKPWQNARGDKGIYEYCTNIISDIDMYNFYRDKFLNN